MAELMLYDPIHTITNTIRACKGAGEILGTKGKIAHPAEFDAVRGAVFAKTTEQQRAALRDLLSEGPWPTEPQPSTPTSSTTASGD